MSSATTAVVVLALVASAASQTIQAIQGPGFISPYDGLSVTGVRGIVTAKGSSGFWLTGTSDNNIQTSDSINVYTTSATIRAQVNVGDEVILAGKLSEYRSTTYPTDLHLTEIESPTNITKISTGNVVAPIVLGKDRIPPNSQYSALDKGNLFGYPNNVSNVETVPPNKLNPYAAIYGLDFWESLEGALVTVPSPVALGFNDNYKDFWVHGAWPTTGGNSRGGLSITADSSGNVDGNPEAIQIGDPLDGTSNPAVKLGTTLSDITGIVTYAYDFYNILPLTAPKVLSSLPYNPPATNLTSVSTPDSNGCTLLTFGDYNVENLDPKDDFPSRAKHIVNYLKSPDILFLQEIQDGNGATNNGLVSANVTLQMLTAAIVAAGGPNYAWTQIDPVDGTNGGEPGGNIRPAYLYRSEVLTLVNPNIGAATTATQVVGSGKTATLSLNPGLIDPNNAAFVSSRKPLAALWKTTTGSLLWTIDVHQSSKDGSTSLHGALRPPVNGALDQRIAQATVEANFISTILAADPTANVIIAGDFNEFPETKPVFAPFQGLVRDLDEVVGVPAVERYTYVFDMNSQQLDHALVSKSLEDGAAYEHVHVNTWADSVAVRVSDHDPSVGRVQLCPP